MWDLDVFKCSICSWVYDENKGDLDHWIPPGTRFEDIPDTWKCPVCGVWKSQFKKIIKLNENGKKEESKSYFWDLERDSDDMESEFRSIFDKALSWKSEVSPMRTKKFVNLLEDILFLPAQLARKPLREDETAIKLKTVIWKKSKYPIEIDVPFFVSHMSFGSLSREAKIALAKGSALSKTLICSWEGWMLPEEKGNAHKYIFEYSTGRFWASEAVMKQADGIEIKIGQAAKAGMGWHLPWEKVTEEIAKVRHVEPWKTIVSPANHVDINNKEDLKAKVEYLRELSGGKPIWIKFAAGRIEEDLAVAVYANPDFITIDCRGWATGAAPTHIKDNVCIPAPFVTYRARKYLDENGYSNITLIITWWIRTSADIAKLLAMWADAIGLSTAAMIWIGCQQYRVCHKGTCPVWIATQKSELREKFDIEKSAHMLHNLFSVYKHELEDYVRILWKEDIHEMDNTDLVTLSSEISNNTNIKHA